MRASADTVSVSSLFLRQISIFGGFLALERIVLKGLQLRHEARRERAERTKTMHHSRRYYTLFFATALTLLSTLGGCSTIGEAIDCEQMCEQMQTCIDGSLDVHRCADRCEDKADDNKLRNQLDECTDCLDQNYSCGEVPDKCPACQGVTDELL